jgi:hypothetical protein
VKALARQRYRQVLLEINEWLAQADLAPLRRPVSDVHEPWEVDNKLMQWMLAMFYGGSSSEKGSLAIAAVKYLWPEFGPRGALRLPRADPALLDWRRLPLGRPGPLVSRLPLPWEAVGLIAEDMIVVGDPWLGVLTVLSFCCYLRPSEPLELRGGNLIPPPDSGDHHFWSIVLPSGSRGLDVTMVIDKSPFLAVLEAGLRDLKRMCGVNELVFQFTQAEWGAAFQESALRVGVADLNPGLYGLRHGGVNFDLATRARPDLEVTLRARPTLSRYE